MSYRFSSLKPIIDLLASAWELSVDEISKKLKDEGVQEVIGFALVGNLNLSYDAINEI